MTFSRTVLSLKLDEEPNAAPASVVDNASRNKDDVDEKLNFDMGQVIEKF